MKYLPRRIYKEYSIPAGGTISDSIEPDFQISRLIVVSKGADVSASFVFAGKLYSDSFSVVSDFGKPCVGSIEISASNSGSSDETLSVEVLGVELWQR